ncbi:MAG: hypothetical protein KVP17_003056 [Porospora cf. gigantea B]|uniref:uncharacterized protein n=1 Tax=Porospora cf. gigantea B TaxID=2853592 RepID=UPI003571F75D|nr:MAG: hypothetical protein KVP17_003056 [Porospora cf. gigantea B]
MRSAVVDSLVPKLLKFAPDVMFLSAGFDGHAKDIIHNGRGGYTYQDIHWLTEILVGVANSCCEGRLISVLEGGYNTKALSLSPFARSVGYHVDVLSRCPVEWDVEKMLRFYRSEAELFRREREAMAEAMALDFDRSTSKHQLDNAEELLPHPKRPRSMRSSALKALDEIKLKISAEEGLRNNAGEEVPRADSSPEGLDGVIEESNDEEAEGTDADGEEVSAPDDEPESDAALVRESAAAESAEEPLETPPDSEEDVVLLSAVATHTIDDDIVDVEEGWAQEKQVLV